MASDYSFGIFSRKKNVSIKSINNCRSYTTFVFSIVNDFAVVGSAIDFQHLRECYCLRSGLTRVSESPLSSMPCRINSFSKRGGMYMNFLQNYHHYNMNNTKTNTSMHMCVHDHLRIILFFIYYHVT